MKNLQSDSRGHRSLAPTHFWDPVPSGCHHHRVAVGRTNQKPGKPHGGAGEDPAESLRRQTGPGRGRTPGSLGSEHFPGGRKEQPAAASPLHIAVLRQTHWDLPSRTSARPVST